MKSESERGVAASVACAAEPFDNKPETAKRLAHAGKWMRRGIVPFYKVSKRVMFRWSEVQAVAGAEHRHMSPE